MGPVTANAYAGLSGAELGLLFAITLILLIHVRRHWED
jgi:hypothetical protein